MELLDLVSEGLERGEMYWLFPKICCRKIQLAFTLLMPFLAPS